MATIEIVVADLPEVRSAFKDAAEQIARLRSALAGLIGASEPDDLRKMRDVIFSDPFGASAEDQAVALAGIDALLATHPGV